MSGFHYCFHCFTRGDEALVRLINLHQSRLFCVGTNFTATNTESVVYECRYREHVVWTDKDLNLKLMRKGLLTRLYVPAV